jgi:hypothetical protein
MNLEIIIKEDFKEFKIELPTDIRQLLQTVQGLPIKLLKSNEVGKLLNISQGTLQDLPINRNLSFTRIGVIIYERQEDINMLLELASVGLI